MAFVSKSFNKDSDKLKEAKAPMLSAGGSGTLSGSNPAQPQAAPVAPAKTQSSFTNIQKYLDQNKGAGQANADRIVNPIQQGIDNTKELSSNITQSIQAPTVTTPDTKDLVRNAPLTQDILDTIKSSLDTRYTGPTAETLDWGEVDTQAKKAREGAQQLQTEAGRIEALQRQQAGNVSRGAATLDNLFIQTDPSANSNFNERLQTLTSQADSIVPEARKTAEQRIADAQQQAEGVRTNTQKNIQDLINERLESARAQAQAGVTRQAEDTRQAMARLESALQNGGSGISSSDLSLLGLDPASALDLIRQASTSSLALNSPSLPQSAYRQGQVSVDPSFYMDADTKSRLSALGGLIGQSPLNEAGAVSQGVRTLNPEAFTNYLHSVIAERAAKNQSDGSPFTGVDLSQLANIGGVSNIGSTNLNNSLPGSLDLTKMLNNLSVGTPTIGMNF